MRELRFRDEKAGRPAAGFDPEPWRNELLAFVRRLGVREDAEDVVQEAFLRAVERPPRTHARAWLYRIALNVVHDRGREERRAEAALPHLAPRSPAAPNADPAEIAEARSLAERAAAIAERLPEKQRLAILLRVQRHMDYDEVAIALDCSVATARQHFHLAVKAVRNELTEDERE
jgi:RNA polymerase sigma-70 factor, ECF subfamily